MMKLRPILKRYILNVLNGDNFAVNKGGWSALFPCRAVFCYRLDQELLSHFWKQIFQYP